jgi:streptogramin lyase
VKLLAGTDEKGHKDSMSDLLEASFNHPRATGVDSQNRIYICDKCNNAVRRIDMVKQTVITLLGPGGVPLDLLNPEGIVVDQYDDVFIADTGHHRILKVSFIINPQTGNEETEVSNYCGKYGVASYANGPAAGSLLHSPTGLAIDKQNHLWICDSGNNCIRMMAHGAELLFTISGKGSVEQEKQYN